MVRLLLFCSGIILFFSAPAWGQELAFRNHAFEYRNEPLKVKVLHQDRAGIFWLGTDQGLFRYNGHQYDPVLLAGKPMLQPITTIAEDRNGDGWIGCQNGQVFQVLRQGLVPFRPAGSLPKEAISAILEDPKGVIWLATYGEGIFYFKQNRLFNLGIADGLPDNYVYALTLDVKGNVWAATDRGIGICSLRGEKKQVERIGAAQGLPDNLVTALVACPDKDNIWVGTYTGGLALVDAHTHKVTVPAVSRNWKFGPVTSLLPGEKNCYIGADGQHLLEYRPKGMPELHEFTLPVSRNRFKISDLQFVAEGFLWVAGNSPEVYSTNPLFRYLPISPGESIHAVLPDRNGNTWYTTDNGIFCAEKTATGYSLKKKFPLAELTGHRIVSLYEDEAGFLWLGTFGNGLFRVHPGTGKIRKIGDNGQLPNANILSVAGWKHELWLATLGGGVRLGLSGDLADLDAPVSFRTFERHRDLGIGYLYQVLPDTLGRVWFATDGNGVTKLEKGRFQNFSAQNGLPGNTVYSLARTRDGSIWASVPKAGLFRYNGNKFSLFPGRLQEKTFAGIAPANGQLFVLHDKGAELVNPKTNEVVYYGEETALPFGEPSLNAVAADREGRVWFGLPEKLAVFEPAETSLQTRPRVHLGDISLFLKPVSVQAGHEFVHSENHLSFHYAGLWYQNPEAVTYRLKLEGYDPQWTVSNNRSITYPQLPPGKYVFKVSASATDNFKGAAVTEFPFEIAAPFWNTWWFYLLAFGTVSGGLFTYIRGREKRLKKAERLEKDKVMFQFETLKNQVNPHFLFNSFNTLISIIEDDQPAAVEYVEHLADFFRDMLLYREKDTISLREELTLIRNYYFLQQKRYRSNLQLKIEVPDEFLEKQVAPLSLQLLVENAIKHNVVSRGKPLLVEIFTGPDDYLAVRNNLQPKINPEKSAGIGLSNIRSRYAILEKRPVLVTQNDTVFEVKVPLISP